MAFKKRAPRAIKEIRKFAEKAMVCQPSKINTSCILVGGRRWGEGSGIDCKNEIGHTRRPSRSGFEQEGMGVRDQGRALSDANSHRSTPKRRGRRQGETVQLRAVHCGEGSQGLTNYRGGGCLNLNLNVNLTLDKMWPLHGMAWYDMG